MGRGAIIMQDYVSLRDFGVVSDDHTDALPAFKAALSQLKVYKDTAPPLSIPAGRYFLSDTLNIHQPLRIVGPNGGSTFGGAILRFPPNKPGIVVHEWRTTDDGGGLASGVTGLGDAGGSCIEKLTLIGGGAQNSSHGPWTNPAAIDPGAHGIWVRAVGVVLRDIYTGFWSGHGTCVEATSGTTGSTAGNANNFSLENIWAYYCQGFGFSAFGTDANCGRVSHCSAIGCAQGGFQEYTFLGNKYGDTCHVRDCGMNDPNQGNAPTAACVYNGAGYYVAPGKQDAASTTVPGTDNTVWVPRGGMNVQRQWKPGLKWVFGGPYVTNPANQGNNQSVFSDCYQETGQPPSYFNNPVMIVGGNMGANGVTGDGCYIASMATGGTALGAPGFASLGSDGALTQFGMNNGRDLFYTRNPAGGAVRATINPNLPGGETWLNFLVNESRNAMGITLGNADPKFGPGAVITNKLLPGPNMFGRIGFVNNLDELTAIEGGRWAMAGDVFFFLNPSPSKSLGAMCVTAGTIGSDAVFKTFGSLNW